MYRPLPEYLKIKESKIEGVGLFTEKDLPREVILGVSHIWDNSGKFHNDLIRTPLGGFINHAADANLIKEEWGDFFVLKTKKAILAGEELTLMYTLYKCGENQEVQ